MSQEEEGTVPQWLFYLSDLIVACVVAAVVVGTLIVLFTVSP